MLSFWRELNQLMDKSILYYIDKGIGEGRGYLFGKKKNVCFLHMCIHIHICVCVFVCLFVYVSV